MSSSKCLIVFIAGLLMSIINNPASAVPKTLLIGLDGVQYERVMALQLPNLTTLRITPAYTGGMVGTPSQQSTYSGPGWTTILTGVWANKHYIQSNDTEVANRAYPSLFKRIRDASPGAHISALTNWPTIVEGYLREDVKGNNVNRTRLSDAQVIDETVTLLCNTPAHFVFVQLSGPDNVGHDKGFGQAYDDSLRVADQQVGKLLAAVAACDKPEDDRLILVTTDHGRAPGSGQHHGNQTESEKTIFIASNKPMNPEFSERVDGMEDMSYNGIYGRAAQTSIAPTILRHMGVALDLTTSMDGNPLMSSTSVRKAMLSKVFANRILWYSGGAGTVTIYRNDILVGSVSTSSGGWTDNAGTAGASYKLVSQNTSVSLSGLNAVRAALGWSDKRSYYILKDYRYMRYNNSADRADYAYHRPTYDYHWGGIPEQYLREIISGVSRDDKIEYIFLEGGRYFRYNKNQDEVEHTQPWQVNDSTWPGMGKYASQIRSAVRWSGDRMIFILDGARYVFFNFRTNKVDSSVKVIDNSTWPGVGNYASEIDALVKFDSNTIFIFLNHNRYIRYNISKDSAEPGYPMTVNNKTWPGLL